MKASRGLEAGLIAAACAAPLFFGCVHEWASAGLSAYLFVLLIFNPEAVSEVRKFPLFIKVAGGVLFIGGMCQFAGIARDGYSAGTEWLQWLAFSAAFLLVQRLDVRGISWLAWIFVLIGVCEALYAVWQLSTGSNLVLWKEKTQYFGYATGTYMNRNHLAGLLELCLGVHLGALLQAFKKRQMLSFGVLALLWLAVLGVFFKTGSRAGLVSFSAACSLVFILRAILFKKNRALFPLIFIALFSAAMVLWGGSVLDRFHSRDLAWNTAGRFETWGAVVEMIRHNPWGVGLGGFELVFPRYQSALALSGWAHAHQDYLELLAELGISGFLAWMVLITGLLASFLRVLAASDANEVWPGWGILIALSSLGFHALMDFNFAIPANAFLSILLLAAGVALKANLLRTR